MTRQKGKLCRNYFLKNTSIVSLPMSSLVHLTFWKKANSLFIDISDEESAAAFINEFQEITSTSYNFKAGTQDQRDTKTLPCSGARKCIHNVTKFSKKNSNEARADQQPGKILDVKQIIPFYFLRSLLHLTI